MYLFLCFFLNYEFPCWKFTPKVIPIKKYRDIGNLKSQYFITKTVLYPVNFATFTFLFVLLSSGYEGVTCLTAESHTRLMMSTSLQ